MKRLNLLTLSLLVIQLISAQNSLDILTISGRYTTPQDYDSSLIGKARESGSFVGLTVPVPISKKTIIINSLNYFYFHVNNEPELAEDIIDPTNLHGFILRSGILQRLNNEQSIQLLLAPRFMTDMQGGGMDNFQFGALVMYEKVFRETLTMGFGGMYNQEFFGPYFVPLINLDWQLTRRLSISGMLPVYAKVKYKFSDKFEAGISHFGLTTSFGLNNPAYEEDYVERQSIDLALFGRYKIAGNFYLEGRFGQSISRIYEQYSADQKVDFALPLVTFGDEREAKNIQFEDGLFCELRVVYSIIVPKD